MKLSNICNAYPQRSHRLVVAATANPAYLEDNYTTTTRILERVPYVTRPGMEILIAEARKTNPAIKVTGNDVVDDTIVRQLEQEGFINLVYAKK